jgi:hypothetical protein
LLGLGPHAEYCFKEITKLPSISLSLSPPIPILFPLIYYIAQKGETGMGLKNGSLEISGKWETSEFEKYK